MRLTVLRFLVWLLPISLVTARTLRTVTLPSSLPRRTTTCRLSSHASTTRGASNSSHLLSSIRGGASSNRGGDHANVFQLMSPYWTSFSKLVQDHVEPAIKDPNGRILAPLQRFAQSKTQAAKERHEFIEENPKKAVMGLLGVGRIVKLSIAAWLVAELLHQAGFFNNPQGLAPKLQKVWREHAEGPLSEVRYHVREWYNRERMAGGLFHLRTWREPGLLFDKVRTIPPRYQFAVGAGVGMIVSPILWSFAGRILKAGIVVYLFAELNEYWRETSSVGESIVELCGFKGNAGDAVDSFLETFRETVRETVSKPQLLWMEAEYVYAIKDFMPVAGHVPANAKQGFLLGAIAGFIIV